VDKGQKEMASVQEEGRIVIIDGRRVDLWAGLEPDDRLKAASFLISVTKISGAIERSTLRKFKDKCEHKLRMIEEYERLKKAVVVS
jgi:3-mercaptopyruvate sulfurtransferase SseA